MTDRSDFNKKCQICVDSLCSAHAEYCANPRCFTKDGCSVKWFCVLPTDLEGECIPDSLQPGHGVRVEVPALSHSQFTTFAGDRYLCLSDFGRSAFKIVCSCSMPGVHPNILRLLCKCYNKRL
ncbi:E3 12.5K [Bottlenose dolphin adenovirus 1]|uniref:E3 12.5K n=1 Tax=Bottlenose dolphin adenovirus 1 TaxID=1714377 RepID=A0A1X7MN66_9ADEN|nr:E3 12.5K [Bottlenose dolphin adenovirus 1]SMG83456.1 E3 12.5K [Bottlenose dolphin adenovirus 1]